MSNGRRHRRRLTPPEQAVAKLLGPLDGARIPGGCDHCDAYQSPRPLAPGVWIIDVFHDNRCPVLTRTEGNPR